MKSFREVSVGVRYQVLCQGTSLGAAEGKASTFALETFAGGHRHMTVSGSSHESRLCLNLGGNADL